jgi:hypothetical protein
MATTPEGKVKKKVKEILTGAGAYFHMPVMNGMGEPTLDFIVCYQGAFLAIETKAPTKKPTPRQEVTIDAIRTAGGRVVVISGEEGYEELKRFLLGEIR